MSWVLSPETQTHGHPPPQPAALPRVSRGGRSLQVCVPGRWKYSLFMASCPQKQEVLNDSLKVHWCTGFGELLKIPMPKPPPIQSIQNPWEWDNTQTFRMQPGWHAYNQSIPSLPSSLSLSLSHTHTHTHTSQPLESYWKPWRSMGLDERLPLCDTSSRSPLRWTQPLETLQSESYYLC